MAGSFSGGERDRKGGARLARDVSERARAPTSVASVSQDINLFPVRRVVTLGVVPWGGPLLEAGSETTLNNIRN